MSFDKEKYNARRDNIEVIDLADDDKSYQIIGYVIADKKHPERSSKKWYKTLDEAVKILGRYKRKYIRAIIRKPIRGQDATPELEKLALWTQEDFEAGKCTKDEIGTGRVSGAYMMMTKSGIRPVTRKMKRQRLIDRSVTSPNIKPDHNPPYTKREPIKLPTKDPNKTNRERMLEQREKRNGRKSKSLVK